MTRHLLTFAITFAIGAAVAVVLRTAGHQPYAGHAMPPATAAPEPMPAPTASAPPATPPPTAPAGHSHPADQAAAPAQAQATVNTICPGCGDPIDPKLPFADYKGHKIGFGCAMCPPKFKADPVKYGEAALKNVVAE